MANLESEMWSKEDVLEVAKRQYHILWIILPIIFGMILSGLVTMLKPFIIIIIGIMQTYFIYKLAQAVRSSPAWLYIILAFIPFINLLSLLYLNGKATKRLKANGIKVGLMGAKSSDLERLKTSA